jgi:archaellum biogenesis protein FlaJ (TadC family)
MSTLKAVFVFVSISVMIGDFASDGRTTLFTEFLTSSITSFTFALVFVVIVIFDIPSDEFEVILSTHLISFISLYILSVMSLSMSSGLVPR